MILLKLHVHALLQVCVQLHQAMQGPHTLSIHTAWQGSLQTAGVSCSAVHMQPKRLQRLDLTGTDVVQKRLITTSWGPWTAAALP